MVVRHKNVKVQTPEQARRAAQRRLAKEIKEGTYKPSKIGQKARQVVSERKQLIAEIKAIKDIRYSGQESFDQARSDKHIDKDLDGKNRSVKDLKKILQALEDDYDDEWWEENDYEDVLYYH